MFEPRTNVDPRVNVQRTYLFVSPEEKSEVQALGARWDTESKRWYIDSAEAPAIFSRWLADTQYDDDGEFTITSTQGFVAEGTASCQRCHARIEVICIYCDTGTAYGNALTRFTISDISAMDEALARQLEPWPNFRQVSDPSGEAGNFMNHCPRCGSPQEDMYLHSEPDEVFFDIPSAGAGAIRLTPLEGTIQLSGDEHFEVN
jgi:hypothetical protein